MARQKEFAPSELIDQAMNVFWQQGYQNTSLSDLVEATGVQRYGIYSTFNNKRDLLLAALDHYQKLVLTKNLLPLTQPDAGLAEIQQAFHLSAEYITTEYGGLGCFMCNTTLELAGEDEAVAEQAAEYSQLVTGLLHQALVNAQKVGDISNGVDVEALSNFLFGALIGIPTLARVGQSTKALNDYIQGVLSILGHNSRSA